jgi:transposase
MLNVTKIDVGVDVSKKRLDVHILPLNKALSIANSQEALEKLVELLSAYEINQVVCESSGGYESLLITVLQKHGIKTWIVEPKRIRAFIYSEGKRAKTDKIDAKMIALFATKKHSSHETQYEKNKELLQLVVRRKELSGMISMEKNRLQTYQDNCKQSIKQHITFLEKAIARIDNEIDKIIRTDVEVSNKIKILESTPGVGRITAVTLLASTPELGNVTNKQIASLIGVAPHPRESGKSVRGFSTAGGRRLPRKALFMAALVGARYNKTFSEFYKKLVKSGKKPKVALGALMRKIIVILNVMIKKETVWNYKIA